MAIGSLEFDGVRICTATLFAERRALTAAHCLPDTPGYFDFVVYTIDAGPHSIPIVATAIHPTLDAAVLTLGAALPEEMGAASLALRTQPLSESIIGATVELAGAGMGTPTDLGITYGAFLVTELDATSLSIDASAPLGLCRGDSGGPVLQASDMVEIVGIESMGTPDCAGPDHAVRADSIASFAFAAASGVLPAVVSACDNDTPSVCDGDVARACYRGYWRARDCTATSQHCGWLDGNVGYTCLPEPCGALGADGDCLGGKARWCNGGGIEVLDCGARRLGCGLSDLGMRCIACDACNGMCVDLASDLANCGACDRACAVQDGSGICSNGTCRVAACNDGYLATEVGCVAEGTPVLLADSTSCRAARCPTLGLALLLGWRRRRGRWC